MNDILVEVKKILKSKVPTSEFISNYDFLEDSKEVPSNFIPLYESKKRCISINKDNLIKLEKFLETLKTTKTKREQKLERKNEKIIYLISSQYTNLKKELQYKENNFLSILGEVYLKENRMFLEKALNQELFSILVIEKNSVISKIVVLDLLEKTLINLKNKLEKIKSLIKEPLLLNNLLDDNKTILFKEDVEKELFILHKQKNKTFLNRIQKDFSILDDNIKLKLNVKYKEENLIKLNIDELKKVKNINVEYIYDMLDKEIKKEESIENYIQEIFEKIASNYELLNKDFLLKESIYEDFKNKILNTKDKSNIIKASLLLNPTEELNKAKLDSLKKIIYSKYFDIKDRRLRGFERSFNRKIINNNIEIKEFKELFPLARERNREIIFFNGETNSGKTYSAFELAKKYNSGIYAAPLRLLALEGQQEFEKRGMKCSMITGEERDLVEGANFISSTVEMIDYSKEYDVAIIDEVQLINDPDRGHAWLEAIVGVNAKKVILVGAKDIQKVIEEISNYLNEPLECKTFKRKTKLCFDKNLYFNEIKKNKKLPKNSAVVAFSKKDVLALKSRFEKMGNKVAVIYGALPPQVRRVETERFVSGEADVVIATDAIGMGLNLPIENIFFYKVEKFNGKVMSSLEADLIKQIVGRAGRYNMFETGYVSALSTNVFNFIKEKFKENTEVSEKRLKCSPNYPIINQIEKLTNEKSIYKLLQTYNNSIRFDFNIDNHLSETSYPVAKFIDSLFEEDEYEFLSLFEKVKIINAPISNDRNGKVMKYFFNCLIDLKILRKDIKIHPISIIYKHLSSLNDKEQKEIEISIKKVDILSWLIFNFEEFSCLKSEIENKRNDLNKKLINCLRELDK